MESNNTESKQTTEVHKDIEVQILINAQESADLMQKIGGAIDSISYILEKDITDYLDGKPRLFNDDQRINIYTILKLLALMLASGGDKLKDQLPSKSILN